MRLRDSFYWINAMVKELPDYSFERGGRSLGDWLWDLVSADASKRLAGGEALLAMWGGVRNVHTDLEEIELGPTELQLGQDERFNGAVRSALRSPEFDGQSFVRKLILYRRALKNDEDRRLKKKRECANDRNVYQDRLLRRLGAANEGAEQTEASGRYMRWVTAKAKRDLRGLAAFGGGEAKATPGLMSHLVFEALDEALLADRPGLRAMLADKVELNAAADALERIGPPAVDFASVLFEELDAGRAMFCYVVPFALGSIGRDDPDVIDGLLRRLRSGPIEVRVGAAAALGHAGPPLAGRLEIALDLLFGAVDTSGLVWAAIPALASIGRESEAALGRVLELAGMPPRGWRMNKTSSDRFDEVMAERGVAIDSLHHFRRFADRVVPALICAFDSIEEYDSDGGYEGERVRVCRALERFGPLAAPAVPRLVTYMEKWFTQLESDEEWPHEVFRLIAAIGPAAAGSLSSLERFRAKQLDVNGNPFVDFDLIEPLDRAILALRRGRES